MRKIVLTCSMILILVISSITLSGCMPEVMLYKDIVWYSEDPQIEIFMDDDRFETGTVNNGTETIEVAMAWGPGGGFFFIPPDVVIHSKENQLFEGEWSWDKRAKTLTITVIDDKIWDYAYETIVLRYREV